MLWAPWRWHDGETGKSLGFRGTYPFFEISCAVFLIVFFTFFGFGARLDFENGLVLESSSDLRSC